MQIDISGTVGETAWEELRHFDGIRGSRFGPEEGSSGPCPHPPEEPHLPGEWCGAVVEFQNNFLAEYALPHYLEQARVLNAYIETDSDA
ncbi:MAG: hypothetical protein A3J28_12815 [Acidobacteria bacterium RIFCSPLOWO2_12_FULL_60_22]|nr:MAG: hypothetical protein A3J28_12815 [Acidobacteria bacterium RIFCSPLOWO2_12_FULL_60_22]